MNVSATITSANLSINTVRAGLPSRAAPGSGGVARAGLPRIGVRADSPIHHGRVESARSDPQVLAINALNRHLSPYPPGDPRAIATFNQDIENFKNVTLAEVKKFYNDFSGTSNAELAIMGHFDAAEMQKIAGEVFGNWKSPAPYEQVKRAWKKLDVANQTIETPDKTNAFFAAGTTMNLDDADPDYPALLFANTMIGGGWNRGYIAVSATRKD